MTQTLLHTVEIQQLRVLKDVGIDLSPGLNVLAGGNGSGKTSFLEAIHLLGTGRSFRSRRIRPLVNRESDWLRVRADVGAAGESYRSLGLEHSGGELKIRYAGEEVKAASSLAKVLPLVVVWPESYRLLTDGASERRKVMDWCLFHVEHDYLAVHQRFRRASRQRNVLLKAGAPRGELAPWTAEVGEAGQHLHEIRERRLGEILPAIADYVSRLCSVEVRIGYEPGWDTQVSLVEQLEAGQARDLARGYSDHGPQRADLKLGVDTSPAHQVLSRGEGKMFVMALMLGQANYLACALASKPVVLVDELASELDGDNRAKVLRALDSMGVQAVLTAVSADLVECADEITVQMFHVEQGEVSAVL